MPVITPITRRRQMKRIRRSSVLILNDLEWVRPEIWRKKMKINITICFNSLNNRLYIFLRLPPWENRILFTIREVLWRTEFLNFQHSFNVTPGKLLKWLQLCWKKDVLVF